MSNGRASSGRTFEALLLIAMFALLGYITYRTVNSGTNDGWAAIVVLVFILGLRLRSFMNGPKNTNSSGKGAQ